MHEVCYACLNADCNSCRIRILSTDYRCGSQTASTLDHLEIMQTRLLLLYQLPPRRFWTWFLENGFSVLDLIVVSCLEKQTAIAIFLQTTPALNLSDRFQLQMASSLMLPGVCSGSTTFGDRI
jgi:hypothetical protein